MTAIRNTNARRTLQLDDPLKPPPAVRERQRSDLLRQHRKYVESRGALWNRRYTPIEHGVRELHQRLAWHDVRRYVGEIILDLFPSDRFSVSFEVLSEYM